MKIQVIPVWFFAELLAVTCLAAATPSHDGWRVMPIRSQQEFIQGKIGGEAEQHGQGIARCLNHPEVIYLSHDVHQIWKSTDAGVTWEKPLCRNLPLVFGQSIEVDPVDPYIVFLIVAQSYNWLVTNRQGLYRSTDGGNTWEFVLPMQVTVNRRHQHCIEYDRQSITDKKAMTWYVASPEEGIRRSDDGGNSWTQPLSLTVNDITQIYDIKCHPAETNKVYAGTNKGFHYSDDRAETMTLSVNIPAGHVTSILMDLQDPNMIDVTIKERGLYRSVDGGQSFSLQKSFNTWRAFNDPGHPETIYMVGLGVNTIISHDGGNSWIEDMVTVPATGLGRSGSDWKSKIEGYFTGIVPNPDDANEAVAYSRGTIWKTTDGGHTFQDSSALFTGFAWSWCNDSVTFDPFDPNRFAFFNADVGMTITETGYDYFDRRNDQAWTWYSQGKIAWIGAYSGDIQPVQGSQVIVASIGNYWSTELMRSEDSGRNWELVTQDPENNLFIAFHPGEPNIVYADNKMSYDSGRNFTMVDFGQFNASSPSILDMCKAVPDTIYAMNESRTIILRSNDRGLNWYQYANPGWSFKRLDGIPTFAVDPADCNKVYTLDANHDLAVFDGSNWRSMGVLQKAGGQELNNFVRTVAIDPNNSEIIYAGTYAAGLPCIFRSTDNGYTWQDITYNLPRAGMQAMAVNPHTGELFIGSASGTWVFPPPYGSENMIYDKLVPRPLDIRFDLQDLAIIAARWQGTDCGTCDGADLSYDGDVTMDDVFKLSEDWLVGRN